MSVLAGRRLALYLFLCAVWGSTWLFIKIGLRDLPPLRFAAIPDGAGLPAHRSRRLHREAEADPAGGSLRGVLGLPADRAVLWLPLHGFSVDRVGARGDLLRELSHLRRALRPLPPARRAPDAAGRGGRGVGSGRRRGDRSARRRGRALIARRPSPRRRISGPRRGHRFRLRQRPVQEMARRRPARRQRVGADSRGLVGPASGGRGFRARRPARWTSSAIAVPRSISRSSARC